MKSNSEHDVDIRLKKFNKETKEWEGCDVEYFIECCEERGLDSHEVFTTLLKAKIYNMLLNKELENEH